MFSDAQSFILDIVSEVAKEKVLFLASLYCVFKPLGSLHKVTTDFGIANDKSLRLIIDDFANILLRYICFFIRLIILLGLI